LNHEKDGAEEQVVEATEDSYGDQGHDPQVAHRKFKCQARCRSDADLQDPTQGGAHRKAEEGKQDSQNDDRNDAVGDGTQLIDEDRHFYSIVLQHQINDCLRYVLQHDFGYQEDGEVVVNSGPRTITFDEAKWYGINQYLIYEFDQTTSAALRVEWFRDQDHSRVAVPVKFNPGGTTFLGGNYIAVTGGVNLRPNDNVTIRPEVRWDYSDLKGNGGVPGGDPSLRAFDDARHSSQVTAAVDVIISF